MTQASKPKKTIGFVELPDEALDVFSHYAQRPDWQVGIVVSVDAHSYTVRMADLLKIPVLDTPNRPALVACDRVVVGNKPPKLLQKVRDLFEESQVEIVSLEEALTELGKSPGASTAQSEPAMDIIVDERGPGGARTNAKPASVDPGEPEPKVETKPARSRKAKKKARSKPANPGKGTGTPARPPQQDAAKPTAGAERPGIDASETEAIEAAIAGLFTTPTPSKDFAGYAPGAGFDAGSILGGDLREQLGALPIDADGDELLHAILRLAVEVTGAQSGSLMLLDEQGSHLRIAVAEGLPDWVVAHTRQEVGKGIAGEVFANGKARLVRGKLPASYSAVSEVRPALREGACVPIPGPNGPIGVLNINVESNEFRLDAGTLGLLSLFAKETSDAVVRAVDLRRLTGTDRRAAVLRKLERLMARDEALMPRLRLVGDVLCQALEAEYLHLFEVNQETGDLELRTAPLGTTMVSGRSQSMTEGFLGWLMQGGAVQVLEARQGDERQAMLYMPVISASPYALLVLEKVPVREDCAGLEAFLGEVQEMIRASVAIDEATGFSGSTSDKRASA